MRKPEAPEDEAAANADKSPPANEQPGMKQRRQVIEDHINALKEFLKHLRSKPH